jgi:hypothetical protein
MRIVHRLAAVIVFATACSKDGVTYKDVASSRRPAPTTSERIEAAQTPSGAAAASFWGTQKLIRTADLRIQVQDVPTALRRIDSIAKSQQTLLANSRTSQDGDGKRTAQVVLRVPSSQFGELLKSLRALGAVQNESIQAEDVTKAYADLETRMLVKQQTVTRLRGLLENRTAKLADVLEVERELGRAVAELEGMKGERRYYDQQIALSTVTLTFFERVPSQIGEVTKPIVDALHDSLQVLGRSIATVIYIVVALAPWMVLGLGTAWLVVVLRRRFAKPAVSVVPESV